ncbi:hypothetical protein [Thermoleophilum album]|uniref:Transposase n=1 Tax=Thermoleophilum album TaxID=29539 RepID=A0A1H6FJX9_THEAL|nr:hypothetical protein [Thermoleophilum album]SEH10468.1 hypothetical protein SAMN02745716_0322 [Thermoleophilum album]
MIVIGADTHKSTHTLAAVSAATGQAVATRAVNAKVDGMLAAGRWARGLDGERVWAIEDPGMCPGAAWTRRKMGPGTRRPAGRDVARAPRGLRAWWLRAWTPARALVSVSGRPRASAG